MTVRILSHERGAVLSCSYGDLDGEERCPARVTTGQTTKRGIRMYSSMTLSWRRIRRADRLRDYCPEHASAITAELERRRRARNARRRDRRIELKKPGSIEKASP